MHVYFFDRWSGDFPALVAPACGYSLQFLFELSTGKPLLVFARGDKRFVARLTYHRSPYSRSPN